MSTSPSPRLVSCKHIDGYKTLKAEKVQERTRTRGPNVKVNMLILMSDTGGGHRASAQALEAALEELFPGRIAVTMVDIFTEHSRWPYSASVPAYQVGTARCI